MLKGTRYQKSGKTFKVKKDLPSRVVVTDEILKQLKDEFAEVQKFQSFSTEFTTRIKKIRNFNRSQIDQILLQIGFVNNYYFL